MGMSGRKGGAMPAVALRNGGLWLRNAKDFFERVLQDLREVHARLFCPAAEPVGKRDIFSHILSHFGKVCGNVGEEILALRVKAGDFACGGKRDGAGSGGARAGAGRPLKSAQKRDRNIGIRVSESELLMIKEKAAAAGLGITDFLIECVKKT